MSKWLKRAMLGGLLLLATVSIFNTNETKAATAGSLVNGGYQTAHYGYGGYGRYNPHTFHTGMDVAARYGSAIKSQAAGRVIYSGWMGGYGRVVMVQSGNTTRIYAHNAWNNVYVGQWVGYGQVLGGVGSTGNSTGNHLHYEVRSGWRTLNPHWN